MLELVHSYVDGLIEGSSCDRGLDIATPRELAGDS